MKFIQTLTLGSLLKFVAITSLIIGVLIYVQFQARNLLLGPTISLTDTHTIVQHERTIILEGVARNIVKLTLNGREIHTDEQGGFTQELVLESGYSIIELTAHDRFGRETSVTRKYVYDPLST